MTNQLIGVSAVFPSGRSTADLRSRDDQLIQPHYCCWHQPGKCQKIGNFRLILKAAASSFKSLMLFFSHWLEFRICSFEIGCWIHFISLNTNSPFRWYMNSDG